MNDPLVVEITNPHLGRAWPAYVLDRSQWTHEKWMDAFKRGLAVKRKQDEQWTLTDLGIDLFTEGAVR